MHRSWRNLKVNQFNCFCLYEHQKDEMVRNLLKFINIIYWEVDLKCFLKKILQVVSQCIIFIFVKFGGLLLLLLSI